MYSYIGATAHTILTRSECCSSCNMRRVRNSAVSELDGPLHANAPKRERTAATRLSCANQTNDVVELRRFVDSDVHD